MDFDFQYNLMKQAGFILTQSLLILKREIKEGMELSQIDDLAATLIRDYGGEPAFKNYQAPFANKPYPYNICVSLNDVLVHGYPEKNKFIKDGDVVKLDLGVKYKGFYADAALTLTIGEVSSDVKKLIDVTCQALKNAIAVALPNNTLGDIGWIIESTIEDAGFKAIKNLCGHDIGNYLHGDLQVLNFGNPNKGPKLKPKMFLAIEPMASFSSEMAEEVDDYVFKTSDGKVGVHFEATIVILDNKNEILTPIV